MNELLLEAINAVNKDGKTNAFSYEFYKKALGIADGTILFIDAANDECHHVFIPKSLTYFCKSFFGDTFTFNDFSDLTAFIVWVYHENVAVGILSYENFEQFLYCRKLTQIFILNKPSSRKSPF